MKQYWTLCNWDTGYKNYDCGNTARLTAFLPSIGLAPTVQKPISWTRSILTFPSPCNINICLYIYFICANIRTVITASCVARHHLFSFVHYFVWQKRRAVILSDISSPWQLSYNNIRIEMRWFLWNLLSYIAHCTMKCIVIFTCLS